MKTLCSTQAGGSRANDQHIDGAVAGQPIFGWWHHRGVGGPNISGWAILTDASPENQVKSG